MPKLILFDFDGVLVMSNHIHIQNIKDTFSESGLPLKVPDTHITRHFGRYQKEIINALIEENNIDRIHQPILEKRMHEKFESTDFLSNFRRIEGLNQYLKDLKSKYNLAIASGNTHKTLETWTKELDMRQYFDLLIGSDDVENGKPAPDMIIKAASHFNIDPKDILYICDAPNDMIMAKSAKTRSAVVLTGVLTRDEAEKYSPDFIIDDVTKLSL